MNAEQKRKEIIAQIVEARLEKGYISGGTCTNDGNTTF